MGAFQVSTGLLTCTRRLLTSTRWCFGLSAHTLPALGLALLEKFTNREASFHKASLRYNISDHCARNYKNRNTISIVEGELEACGRR